MGVNILVKIIIQTVAVLVAAYTLPGVVVADFLTALVFAVVLSIINAFIKPILVLLTLPITIVTLGLFLLVINGLLVLLVGSIVPGFQVSGILWAIIFSIVVSLVSSFLNNLSE